VEVDRFTRVANIRPVPPTDARYFNLCWRGPIWNLDGSEDRVLKWADGPYPEQHLVEKLVGRVIGLFRPDFRNALRLAA
jgi:hypothetical protein